MDSIALFCVAGYVISISGFFVAQKHVLNQKALTATECLMLYFGLGSLFLVVWFFLPFHDWWQAVTSLKPDAVLFWGSIGIAVAANVWGQYAGVRATQVGDLSLIAPIAAITPGLLVITAFLFGEYPSFIGYVGILLIVVGTYVHAREQESIKEYLQPLFIWRLFLAPSNVSNLPKDKSVQILKNRTALRWAYSGAIVSTIGLLMNGLTGRHGDVAIGGAAMLFGLTVSFMILHLFLREKEKTTVVEGSFKERLMKYKMSILIMGALYGIHEVFILTAFQYAPIASIGTLKRLQIPATVFLAMFILGESSKSGSSKKVPWYCERRLILSLVITLGAVLLATDPTQGKIVNSFSEYVEMWFK